MRQSNKTRLNPLAAHACRLLLLMPLLVLTVGYSVAQDLSGTTPLGAAPGVPAGSYRLSGFDNVNLFNGSLSFNLPLVQLGGRGRTQVPVGLPIEQKFVTRLWDVGNETIVFADPYWWNDLPSVPRYGVGSMYARYSGEGATTGCPSSDVYFTQTLTRLTFVAPDGTEYDLRDQSTNGQWKTVSPVCPSSSQGFSRGKVFVTSDGTSATFISDEIIRDFNNASPYISGNQVSGFLLLRDGTRFRVDGGSVSWMRDRNGNLTSFNYDWNNGNGVTTITDSLNRKVTIEYAVIDDAPYGLCDRITLKGFGGADRRIRISKKNLNQVLRQDYTPQPPESLFEELTGSANYDIEKASSVWLPDGRSYNFFYNNYGELARVELPTGGAFEYDWAGGLENGTVSGVIASGPVPPIYRRVVQRRIYREGNVLESRQMFSRPESPASFYPFSQSSGYVTVDQYDGASTPKLLNKTVHYFYGSAAKSMLQGPIDYPAWKDGREYKTELYDVNNGVVTLKKTVTSTFAQRPQETWFSPSADSAPPNDPRLIESVTTLADTNQVTKQSAINPNDLTVGFDQYNNQTDVWEYDFGAGSAGSLLRHTHTSFLTTNSVNGSVYDAVNPNITSPDPAATIHLRNLPSQVSVYDSAGIERARTTIEYDNYSTAANHEALLARSNISGLDPAFSSSYQTRGNATGTTKYLLDTSGAVSGSLSFYSKYDVAGNVVKTIDPRGFVTSLFYNDHFGAPDGEVDGNTVPVELSELTPDESTFAFVTSATNAAGHTSYAQVDYYLGQPVDAQDMNGVVSSQYFNDLLDRPTQMIRGVNQPAPFKSQTTYAYDDGNRAVTSTSDLSVYNDNSLKSQSRYDGLGRTIETRTYENATQYIAVNTVPFVVLQDPDTNAFVQAAQQSNPYRPYLGEQPVWTTSFLDSLGRVSKVRTPDTAILRTYFDGARVLVVDQMGKMRLSQTDALGNLKDVWEITSADPDTEAVSFPGRPEVTAGYHTSYEYDAVSQLGRVIQGTQPQRVLTYNTLGQLVSATNPENGFVNYRYDPGGNLIVTTDARGVSAHYAYDALNRPVRRWYNGSNSTDATTHNNPALPSGVGVSEEANYWYDSQTLPAGAPSYVRGPSTGRPVATTYGTGSSSGDYYGYDAGGRQALKIQQTGGINYQVTAGYNVSGRIISGVYPSGHTVSYGYDGAGRSLSFAGTLGEGTLRNYSSGITYSPLGGLSQEQFGTATPIYNKLFYNVRGQLAEIREGTTPNDTNFERGALINFYSGCWGMCAGSPMPDNNGNLKRQEHWVKDANGTVVSINSQDFDYDSLNRLKRAYEGSTSDPAWQQSYLYDRFGNRRVDTNATSPSLSPRGFEVQIATNRLLAPGDANLPESSRQMRYDPAGNLTTDNYTGQGQRTYDAENHMTQAWAGGQSQIYTYDAGGQRIRRNANGVETWQVYGLGGELLAEYAANAPDTTPQKEYGYRNGQLLIVAGAGAATTPAPSSLTAAPTSGGGYVILTWSAASGASNYRVERKGATGPFSLAGNTGSTSLTDTGVSPGSAYLYRVCAANVQGVCTSVFSNIALGSAVNFPTDPTIISSTEDPTGASVTTVKAAHITELRSAVNAARTLAGLPAAQWTNQTITANVSFINADDVRDLRTKLHEALNLLGIETSDYEDQTLAGAPNGTPIKKIHITQLRQRSTSGIGGAGGSSANQFGAQWLVTDQLGTPRMVFDETGSLGGAKRHDYLPFGEDLVAGARGTTPGYGTPDGVRQKFTGYEHDGETELEFAQARYVSNVQGRFTGPDPLMSSADPWEPQSMNRYSYVINNPLNYTDPLGLYHVGIGADDPLEQRLSKDDEPEYLPADTIKVVTNADKDTGRTLSEGEVAALGLPNLVGFRSMRDEFDNLSLAFGTLGVLADIGQYSNVVNGKWVGWTQSGPRLYKMKFPGNQHVLRSAAVNNAGAFRAIGKTAFYIGTGVNAYQGARALQNKDYPQAGKAGVDMIMGIVGTRGGVHGAIIGGTYFVVDETVGVPELVNHSAKHPVLTGVRPAPLIPLLY